MSAFYRCSQLTSISLPNCTSMGQSVFASCSNLRTLSLPKLSIMPAYFAPYTGISYLYIDIVTSLPNYTFSYMRDLKSVYMRSISAVPSVGAYTFSYSPLVSTTFATDGTYASIYVPASLYNSFLTTAYWSTISARLVSI